MKNSFYVLLFIISIIIASFSQIILKKGSKEKNIFINKYTIVGYLLMLISTLFTLYGYKGVQLSLSQILQSLSFIFIAILSKVFLNEKISRKTIIGICLIIVGIIIYSV